MSHSESRMWMQLQHRQWEAQPAVPRAPAVQGFQLLAATQSVPGATPECPGVIGQLPPCMDKACFGSTGSMLVGLSC